MTDSQQQVEAILGEALALPNEERLEFVQNRCEDNADLQNQVQILLDAIAHRAQPLAETQLQVKPGVQNKSS
ncbi:MAG: hypothetical protein NXI32_14605, partial [bacterium]|nr:hypothetical protein [bacterium]